MSPSRVRSEAEAAYHDPTRVPWESPGVKPFNRPLINHVRIYDLANEHGKVLNEIRFVPASTTIGVK